MRYNSANAQQTFDIGFNLGRRVVQGDCICLEGPLGSGKTVLTKGIARALNIKEEITSPTFTLIKEYQAGIAGRTLPFYHIDLYRIEHSEELYEMGLEEIFDQKAVSVIEWSERAEGLLPANRITVKLELVPDGGRSLSIEDQV